MAAARPLKAFPQPQGAPLRVASRPGHTRHPSPAVIRRRRAVALTGLAGLVALVLVAVVALAGGGDARAQVTSLLERGAASPATICDHLSSRMLAAAGGHEACLRASPARGPASKVLDVRVHGDRATALVRSSAGDERVSLVRQDGDWKVDDVR
jgi:hypothetical protein